MVQMSRQKPPGPVVLCVLDGWGCRVDGDDNAIHRAATPNWDRLVRTQPFATLATSGLDVGLPDGQMGNSEVGHMNLGAGRVVLQDLPRIDKLIADGELAGLPAFAGLRRALGQSGDTCHIMGLVGPGGVHAHQSHLVALARALAADGIPVRLHAFLDGRDTPPRSARDYLKNLAGDLAKLPDTHIATVVGRYFAMDRDQRWDRVAQAYDLLVDGTGHHAADPLAAIDNAYGREENDEFVTPTAIGGFAGMADGDAVLMANFRADRAREILTALLQPEFAGFARSRRVAFAAAAGMCEYSADLNQVMTTLVPPIDLTGSLGEAVALAGGRQLRLAETEKYAHVTFFLNGGREKPFPGEDRILVPSPKVATYDLQPEMSAPEVTDKLVAAIGGGGYDLIVVNFANPDMVGHTGVMDAAMVAAGVVDTCLGRLETALEKSGGVALITADHGNLEMMRDPGTGQPHTAHTTNRVPAVLVNAPPGVADLGDGGLADVAPTLLALMGLDQPTAMSGRSLLVSSHAEPARRAG